MLWLITATKLQLWNSDKNNFMFGGVTTTWRTGFRGHSICKVENHCTRGFVSSGLLITLVYVRMYKCMLCVCAHVCLCMNSIPCVLQSEENTVNQWENLQCRTSALLSVKIARLFSPPWVGFYQNTKRSAFQSLKAENYRNFSKVKFQEKGWSNSLSTHTFTFPFLQPDILVRSFSKTPKRSQQVLTSKILAPFFLPVLSWDMPVHPHEVSHNNNSIHLWCVIND